MDAREHLNILQDSNELIVLTHFDKNGKPDGQGKALIIDHDLRIAVMLSNCGQPEWTSIAAGAIVSFVTHPEAEPKIVGSPAYACPVLATLHHQV